MNEKEMFRALESASSPDEIKKILGQIEQEYGERVRWEPIGGRENNMGTINISADAGRSIVSNDPMKNQFTGSQYYAGDSSTSSQGNGDKS